MATVSAWILPRPAGGAELREASEWEAAVLQNCLDILRICRRCPRWRTWPSTNCRTPESTPKEVHQIISKDQALAARILRVANSSYYSCPRKISRISDAITFMGFDSIRSLVIASVIEDLFKKTGLAGKTALGTIPLPVPRPPRNWPLGRQVQKAGGSIPGGLDARYRQGGPEPEGPGTDAADRPGGSTTIRGPISPISRWSVSALPMRKSDGLSSRGGISPKRLKRPSETITIRKRQRSSHRSLTITCLANSICNKLEIGPVRMPDLDLTALLSFKILELDEETVSGILEDLVSAGKMM